MLHDITDVRLRLRPGAWPIADGLRPKIEAHWATCLAANPHLWNGRVLGTIAPGEPGGIAVGDGVLTGEAVEGDFASFLAWRDWGFPEIGIRNLFGSALVLSSDGALILGVMGATTANAGRIYPPGGSLEPADVDADGNVDVVASIERELREETGLIAAEAVMEGMIAAFDGPRVSVGRVFRFAMKADDLVATVMAELDRQAERELERVVAFRSIAELNRPEVTAYSRAFAARLLAG
ncbi:Acetyltransferase, GNAT family (fragment) [uncultured Pleomorphomonas sp.]|uniref:Acetyltransferase, GNAT family n=1 Tax=uncultured Pleomorphomonas sp. TaxID=442121 RepID=A0A212L455_9HYPH